MNQDAAYQPAFRVINAGPIKSLCSRALVTFISGSARFGTGRDAGWFFRMSQSVIYSSSAARWIYARFLETSRWLYARFLFSPVYKVRQSIALTIFSKPIHIDSSACSGLVITAIVALCPVPYRALLDRELPTGISRHMRYYPTSMSHFTIHDVLMSTVLTANPVPSIYTGGLSMSYYIYKGGCDSQVDVYITHSQLHTPKPIEINYSFCVWRSMSIEKSWDAHMMSMSNFSATIDQWCQSEIWRHYCPRVPGGGGV
ncbi:hypothetical protein K435DRAFT_834761 [Dendrothele bispora CBS 962.96]|uniref:Uncharacterized protein n=1 Tax=Dendrothele bispora (strain CBS 962.96) TaxID=1314807 RepID=A0A4S8MQN4_DENBC|nr:hypothetical protein K435DRAFT_834761 [Dendrothele bispora CBS 962.96]